MDKEKLNIKEHSDEWKNLQAKRTEEVNDIIERMPVNFAKWVAYIVVLIVVLIAIFGWIIKYPDIVSGRLTLNSSSSPINLIANSNGKLRLLGIQPKDTVKEGDYVGIIQNPANTKDMKLLISLMDGFDIHDTSYLKYRYVFPDNIILGEVNPQYYRFLEALFQMIDYTQDNIFEKQKDILNKLLINQQRLLEENNKEQEIRENHLNLANKSYRRDSLLNRRKVIADADFEKSKVARLAVLENYEVINKDITSALYQIQNVENQLQQLKIQRFEKEKQLKLDLLDTYYSLMNSIKEWEKEYAFIAPINGKIEFLNFWKENEFVGIGEEVFAIVPKKNKIIGQLLLPERGAGKVKIGQKVIIKMDNYPYLEYGYVTGRVKSISMVANSKPINSQSPTAGDYLVLIDLPEGLRTNYGDNLGFKFEMKGTAEIITKDRRLAERLFDNLKYQTRSTE